MGSIGFLHTSPVHVDRFEALVESEAPGTEVVSVVDEVLLDRARTHGEDDLILIGGVADRLAQFAELDVVVCTCSTIGGLAERIGAAAGVPVRRVDRAMAEHAVAVAAGGRVAVIVAVESTIEPTVTLLRDVAVDRGVEVEIDVDLVADAWGCFEQGDLAGYEALVATAVIGHEATADVVVLAQASMHPVTDRADLADLSVPLLSSSRLAVVSALGVD